MLFAYMLKPYLRVNFAANQIAYCKNIIKLYIILRNIIYSLMIYYINSTAFFVNTRTKYSYNSFILVGIEPTTVVETLMFRQHN